MVTLTNTRRGKKPNSKNNNNNSGHFYRTVSHWQGWTQHALQDNKNVYIKLQT